jgi:hypothetical protein
VEGIVSLDFFGGREFSQEIIGIFAISPKTRKALLMALDPVRSRGRQLVILLPGCNR